jgi:hypothetical protein
MSDSKAKGCRDLPRAFPWPCPHLHGTLPRQALHFCNDGILNITGSPLPVCIGWQRGCQRCSTYGNP